MGASHENGNATWSGVTVYLLLFPGKRPRSPCLMFSSLIGGCDNFYLFVSVSNATSPFSQFVNRLRLAL